MRKISIKKIIVGMIVLFVVVFAGIFAYEKYTDYKAISANKGITFVCFGDSIWDVCRDETGIAYLVGENLQANVVNMGICGTSAAKRSEEVENAEQWNSMDFISIVEAITEGKRNSYLDAENESIGIYDFDYEKVDYFLIAYGLNDYFNAVEREGEDLYDVSTYAGALRTGIEKLQEAYPEAKIMILSPTYCQRYSYGKVVAESHDLDYGGGTGPDYVETARRIAQEYDLGFSDNYDTMHINVYNSLKYLKDATHFTEEGRRVYARIVSDAIIDDYKRHAQKQK